MQETNILITGGAGYVGSVLIPELIKDGHNVTCLDRFFFGADFLSSHEFSKNLTLIRDDIRWFDSKILKKIDLVLDLAALSNDPVGELDPGKTNEINHLGRARVAKLSKENGVPQYILASSASIYGEQKDIVTEDSKVNPLTAYSKANRKAELSCLPLNDNDFTVTALRFSSIFGLSPRMRFDLAVNNFVLDYFQKGKISVHGKNNRRPFLHIKDAINAYKLVIQSKNNKINGQIFNVGDDSQNYLINDLAIEINNSLPNPVEIETKDTKDHRSFTASFSKISNTLGFQTSHSVADGAREIFDALQHKKLIFDEKMITVKWYNKLISEPSLFKKFQLGNKLL